MDTPPSGSTARFRVLFLLFFLSGMSGLIYESIWSRYIRQFVGSAATAQILVLALFMGGMSLGALASGRFVARTRAPIVVYGVIEGLIGVYALLFPHLQEFVARFAYDVVFPAIGGGDGVALAKWIMAALLILPPCVLLGTTFPLMSVGILRRDLQRSGEILSMLYFTNSLGASMGALLSGFVLVGRIGLPGALMVAAALNIFIMLVAMRDRTPTKAIEERPQVEGGGNRTLVLLFLSVAFGTGLSSFMYEIGWIRLLSMILGSATHSFEVMLSAFILGLALGGFWVRKRMDRFRRPELALAFVQLVMGLSAIATIPAYHVAVLAMGGLLSDYWIELFGTDGERNLMLWYQFNVLRYLLCLLIMLPATFCAGMTLPLLTHVMLKRGQPEGAVGKVYGLNTLGAICGAVIAGLVLMPVIGLKGVIVLGAVVDMLLGIALIRRELATGTAPEGVRAMLRNAVIAMVVATCTALYLPRLVDGLGGNGKSGRLSLLSSAFEVDPAVLTSTVFRNGRIKLPEEYEVLSYVDGRTASVTVVKTDIKSGHHVIYTNGKPDASIVLDRWPEGRDPMDGPEIAGDEPNQFLVGLVPLMARPNAKHVSLIGFGSGVTCHTLLASPTLDRVDTVEIEPEMVEGSRYFMPVNYRAYTDPRSHIHFDDAKAYYAWAGDKYDVIISEPTNPWVSGVSSLFTVEFYQEVKRYLKPGGLLAQWIQGYELSDELFISVLSALDREFADYLIVRIGSSDWVILSSPDGSVGDLSDIPLGWPDAQESFELLGIHDIGQIDGLITANKRILHPFLEDKRPNRDSLPILDTGAEKARFLKFRADFLHHVRWTPAPVLEVFGGIHRRPYPAAGIGDFREPHILLETEQAALLMRRYVDPDVRVGRELSGELMATWRDAQDQLQLVAHPDWHDWLEATWGVYEAVAPHIDLAQQPWWRDVLQVASRADVPEDIRDSIELLDALVVQDGDRIRTIVDKTIEVEDFPLSPQIRAVAGIVSLELRGASAAVRKAFVEKHMRTLGAGDTNEDYALRVLKAYAARP